MDEKRHSLLSVKVTLTEHEHIEELHDSVTLLSRGVWHELGLSQRHSQAIAISIQPLPTYSSAYPIRCWARLSDSALDDGNTVAIPRGLTPVSLSSHETKQWAVSVINPVKLTDVFVKFHDAVHYADAEEQREAFEQWIMKEKRILGSSQMLEVPPGVLRKDPCALTVVLCEPCRVGFLDASSTKVFLSKPIEGEAPSQSSDAEEPHEDDDLVIDERFLEGSVLGSGPVQYLNDGNGRQQGEKRLDVHLRLIINDIILLPDSDSLYLGVNDLNSLGVLSGDWAIALAPDNGKPRLVRVQLHETIKILPGTCVASSILAHNLSVRKFDKQSAVTLRAVNRGAAAFATAAVVNIVRVASPLVTNRHFDKMITEALRDTLSGTPRLVSKGDLIYCHVRPNDTRPMAQPSEDLLLYRRDGYKAPHPNLIYFQVKDFEMPSRVENESAGIYQVQVWLDPQRSRVIEDGTVTFTQVIVDSSLDKMREPEVETEHLETQLRALVTAALRGISYNLYLDDPVLLKGASGAGLFTSVTKVADSMGMQLQEINCYEMVGESNIHTIAAVTARAEASVAYGHCLVVLRHIEALSNAAQGANTDDEGSIGYMLEHCSREVKRQAREAKRLVLFIGIVEHASSVANSILAIFKNELVAEAPSEQRRLSIFSSLIQDVGIAPEASITDMATRSAGLISNDLVDLVDRAEVCGTQASLLDFHSVKLCSAALDMPWTVSSAACENALSQVRKSYSESIGAPKIPNVTWDDIGGLATVKNEVLDTIQLPLDHPELFVGGVKKRSGILFYGPPGTGKTLVAKAVATSCSLNFFSVKGPELLNMYIGESEANVRRIFQRARDARPCVIFFDELDSVAPKRGNQGDSGGVMDRIVSQLLAELDGVAGAGSADVFVIGATNRPDLLDPALLRPGRFDRMLYLGLSETHDQQRQLLQALTRKFRLAPNLDLHRIAQQCPFTLTGADFYALCSDALLRAMARKTEAIDVAISQWNAEPQPGHPRPMTVQYYLTELAKAQDLIVQVSLADFEQALSNLNPSVSQAELNHYASVQAQYTSPVS